MHAERTALEVHVVDVFDRTDGTYYFASEDDAHAFAKAVRLGGSRCSVESDTLIDHDETLALVAQEAEEDAETDAVDAAELGLWRAGIELSTLNLRAACSAAGREGDREAERKISAEIADREALGETS